MKTIKYLILSVFMILAASCKPAAEEETPKNNAIWLWGVHMKEAPIQDWAAKGYRHVLLNEAAFDRWGEADVYAFMDQCDKLGLTVHVWFQAFYFDGKWVSPIDDEKKAIKQDFYDMVIERAKGYVEKGVKGIHLDYIRYGGTAHKHDYPECRATDSITEFCRQLNVALKAINPEVILSAALMPEIDSEHYYGQNPAEMAKYIDILMPMVYRYGYAGEDKSLEWVNEVSNWFVEKAAGNAEVWVGIQTYTVDLEKVEEGEHVIAMNAEQLKSDCIDVTNTNATGVVLFRYGIGDFPDVNDLWTK
jgi:hypothetical protein